MSLWKSAGCPDGQVVKLSYQTLRDHYDEMVAFVADIFRKAPSSIFLNFTVSFEGW